MKHHKLKLLQFKRKSSKHKTSRNICPERKVTVLHFSNSLTIMNANKAHENDLLICALPQNYHNNFTVLNLSKPFDLNERCSLAQNCTVSLVETISLIITLHFSVTSCIPGEGERKRENELRQCLMGDLVYIHTLQSVGEFQRKNSCPVFLKFFFKDELFSQPPV